MTAPSPWLTRTELSDRLQIPVSTLNVWGCQGKGPRFAKFGRHVRYRLDDVIAWEAAQFSGRSGAVVTDER